MITHTCTATLPADVTALVEHLAYCPETPAELVSVCRDLIRTAAEGARIETRTVSQPSRTTPTDPPTGKRDLTPAEMHAMHKDGAKDGVSLRGIGAIAQVAPETVRRRIAKWKREGGS